MFVQFLIILIPFLLKSIFTFAHFLTRMKYTYQEIYRIEYFKLNIQYIYTAEDIKKKRYIKIFICIFLYYYCIFLFSPFYLLYYCQRLHLLKHHDAVYIENPTWNKIEFGADMVDSKDNLVSFDYASFLSYINDVHDFEYTEESAWSGLKTSNVNDKNLYYYVFADMNPLNKRKNKLTLSKYSYIYILRQAVKKKDIIINIVLKDATLYKNTSLWYNYWNNFIPIDYVSHAPYWITVMYNFEQREYKEKYHLWGNPHNKWYVPLKSTDFWDSLSNITLFFDTIYWKIFFSNTSLLFKKNVNNYNNFLNPVNALQNNLKKNNDAYPLIKNALTVVKTNDHLTFLTEYILNKKYGKWSNNLFFLPGVKENKLKNIFNYTSKHFTSWASSFFIESDYSKEYQENILYLFNKDWRLFHHWDITFIIPQSYSEMVAHSYYYFMIQRDAYRYAKNIVGSFHEITSKEMQKGLKERYILTKVNLYLFITDYNFYRVRYSNVSDHFDTYSKKITHSVNYNIKPWGWNINYSKTEIEEDKELPDFVPEMVDYPYDNWILTKLNQGYLNLTYYFVDHIDWFLKIFFIRFFLNEQHVALEDHGLYFHRAVLFPWEYVQDQIEVMWIATQLALFYHYQEHFDEIHHFVAAEAKVRLVMYEKHSHWEGEYKWFNSIKEYLIKLKKFRDIFWSEHLLVWHHLLVIVEMQQTYNVGMKNSYWFSRFIHRTFSNKKKIHSMHMDSFDAFVDYTIDQYDEEFIYMRLFRYHLILDKIYQFPERLNKFFNYDVWYTPKKMFQSLFVDAYNYIISTFIERSYESGVLFPLNEKKLLKFKYLVKKAGMISLQVKPPKNFFGWRHPRFRAREKRKLQRFLKFLRNEKDETYEAPYYWSPDSLLDKWRTKWQLKFPKITTTATKKKEEQFFTISFYRQRNWWILAPFRLRNLRHTIVKSIQYFININLFIIAFTLMWQVSNSNFELPECFLISIALWYIHLLYYYWSFKWRISMVTFDATYNLDDFWYKMVEKRIRDNMIVPERKVVIQDLEYQFELHEKFLTDEDRLLKWELEAQIKKEEKAKKQKADAEWEAMFNKTYSQRWAKRFAIKYIHDWEEAKQSAKENKFFTEIFLFDLRHEPEPEDKIIKPYMWYWDEEVMRDVNWRTHDTTPYWMFLTFYSSLMSYCILYPENHIGWFGHFFFMFIPLV